jgi:hypothetical protein
MKTPTIVDLRKLGYKVKVSHYRNHKAAYVDYNGKIVVKNLLGLVRNAYGNDEGTLVELLPKGGVTEVTVRDPDTNLDFFANSTCRDDECYKKKTGVETCLERIHNLMLVVDGKTDEKSGKVFKIKF